MYQLTNLKTYWKLFKNQPIWKCTNWLIWKPIRHFLEINQSTNLKMHQLTNLKTYSKLFENQPINQFENAPIN